MDPEVTEIIAKAIFGWAANQIPDAQQCAEAVVQALHENRYLIVKTYLPPTP